MKNYEIHFQVFDTVEHIHKTPKHKINNNQFLTLVKYIIENDYNAEIKTTSKKNYIRCMCYQDFYNMILKYIKDTK